MQPRLRERPFRPTGQPLHDQRTKKTPTAYPAVGFSFARKSIVSVVRKTPTTLEVWKKEHLIEALQEMFGDQCVLVANEGEKLPVRGERSGRQMQADIVVRLGNSGDIGFEANTETGNYEVVADWYAVGHNRKQIQEADIENTSRATVVSAVLQKTNHAFVKHGLKKKGFKKHTLKKVVDEEGNTCYEATFSKGGF